VKYGEELPSYGCPGNVLADSNLHALHKGIQLHRRRNRQLVGKLPEHRIGGLWMRHRSKLVGKGLGLLLVEKLRIGHPSMACCLIAGPGNGVQRGVYPRHQLLVLLPQA
jgi:hypothetical protein